MVVGSFDIYKLYKNTPLQEAFVDGFMHVILFYVGLLMIVALLRGVFLYLQRHILIGMSRFIEYDLKNEIYAHYQELPLSFYRENKTGDLMARISEDVSQVRMYLGPAVMYGLNLASLFLIIIPFMLSVDTKLTFYVLIPLPFLSLSIYYINSLINKRSTEIQQGLSSLSNFVQESFSGIRVIKSFVREEDSIRRFTDESNKYRHKSLKLTSVDAFFYPLIFVLTGLSTILVIYIGGMEVINERITFGVIAEFVIYINMLTWPVASLGWITSLVQRAEASQARINEFLNTKSQIVSGNKSATDINGKITFSKVFFTYPESGIEALKDISFEVKPGESLAILGGTGSGKSTLANLVCRLYDPDKGAILVDDIPLKEYNVKDIRSRIGYVPQDVFLFSDTIRNNISFGASDASDEMIVRAAKDADLYDNIIDFPDQFETSLGERGITLSGGQKQRLSIARAVVRDPQILVLDDCLSAVDMKTEHTILQSLSRIMKGRTSIIISHRVSSAKLADQIVVLEDGGIAETGTHKELLQKDGIYAAMYQKQMMAEQEV